MTAPPDSNHSALRLQSFGANYRALVIGSSGALGQAFCAQLRSDTGCAQVTELSRHTLPALDLTDPPSIAAAAQALADQGPYQLILLATGILHAPCIAPEKSLAAIEADALQRVFQINSLGPALVLRHFLPLLDASGAMAVLSAKVGSIEDNRLGGWYAYRASKAALNMLLKTAAIEHARQRPKARLLSLHPGTVVSKLSEPFRGAANARPAAQAAAELLRVIDQSSAQDSGGFFSYQGERLPW
ncbi:MAG: SDR family oxidoreductase [Halopseudomonas sp.]|uniref:SDR family oxidoreductase n=1 Tax=Halopseudomonas sp. TaxID=2901191 RepID=UPI0030020891